MKSQQTIYFHGILKPVFLVVINLIAFIAMIAVNGLAGSTTFLNGVTSGKISDMYPTLITPAGLTFAIWDVIYAPLLIFTIYQTMPKNRDKPFLKQISILFGLSSIWNISWLFLWHYQLVTYSIILMIAFLATLIGIYLRLNIGRANVSLRGRLSVHLPFSVYLGEISIAIIANVAVALTAVGWDGWGIESSTWAVVIIYFALLLIAAVLATRRGITFSLIVAWVLVGILAKQNEYSSIVFASQVGIVLILVAVAVTAVFSRLKRWETHQSL